MSEEYRQGRVVVRIHKNFREFIYSTCEKDEAAEVMRKVQARGLSHWLCLLRHKADLSQVEMAEKMGITEDEVEYIENAENTEISAETVRAYIRHW